MPALHDSCPSSSISICEGRRWHVVLEESKQAHLICPRTDIRLKKRNFICQSTAGPLRGAASTRGGETCLIPGTVAIRFNRMQFVFAHHLLDLACRCMLLNQVEEAGMLLDGYPAALRNVVEICVAPDLQAFPGLTEETNKILVGTTIIEKEMEFFVQLSEGRNKCCS